jgi:hypothetical protein
LPGTYNIEISSSGFKIYSSSIDINKLTVKEIKLEAE